VLQPTDLGSKGQGLKLGFRVREVVTICISRQCTYIIIIIIITIKALLQMHCTTQIAYEHKMTLKKKKMRQDTGKAQTDILLTV